jgi:hypothetical protein
METEVAQPGDQGSSPTVAQREAASDEAEPEVADMAIAGQDRVGSEQGRKESADVQLEELVLDDQDPEPPIPDVPEPISDSEIVEAAAERDGVDQWLWVDPRQEGNYSPTSFDLAVFLERAVALFESKAWTGGQKPQRLAVHPSQNTESLTPVAEALGLEVLSDSQVSPGTYRLGLAEPGRGEQP